MDWYELVGNVHIHTIRSDGSADHRTLAQAAVKVGLDFLIVTDHNVYIGEAQGWKDRVLLLVGEEVHDPTRSHCNHYLVFNAREEMAPFGDDPQRLIDAVGERGGIGFIAHPYEHLFAAFNTHILVTERWSGDATRDAELAYGALASGKCFAGYDGLASTRGFRFRLPHTNGCAIIAM